MSVGSGVAEAVALSVTVAPAVSEAVSTGVGDAGVGVPEACAGAAITPGGMHRTMTDRIETNRYAARLRVRIGLRDCRAFNMAKLPFLP